ncbi:MAG: SDR family NAD(P)-dependent oxidoreductase [Pseudomonadota bacterium]
MAGRLAGKVALVVGAGSSGPGWGNGKAAAVLFAREGATVAALDRDLAAAEETVDLIKGEGGAAFALAADVVDGEGMAASVDRVLGDYDRIDVLHYNVGILTLGGPLETSEADWDKVVDVNLKGLFLTAKAVLPSMLEQGKGAIVTVSTVGAIRSTSIPYISYSSSKAGVMQFTRSVALQYARQGIRANTILPGLMRTPMIEGPLKAHYGKDSEAMMAERDAVCPMGHMGDAWDVAHAALFLASDEARYITGTELIVDGGLSATHAGG